MEIVNESDMDVTWWCYNSGLGLLQELSKEFGYLPGGKGDLPKGGRTHYDPPNGDRNRYYVQFTKTDGERTYSPSVPSNAATLARIDGVASYDMVTFRRGSGKWEAVNAGTSGVQVG